MSNSRQPSPPSGTPQIFEIGASTHACLGIVIAAVLSAAVGVVLLTPAFAIGWVALVALLSRPALQRQRRTLTLRVNANRDWQLREGDAWITTDLVGARVHPWCVMLVFRRGWRERRVWIPADACAAPPHRRLRRLVRWLQ